MESKIEMEEPSFLKYYRGSLQPQQVAKLEVEESRADLSKSNTGFTQMLVTREFRFFWLKMYLQSELYTECSSGFGRLSKRRL